MHKRFWWFVHNAVAHPLLAIGPFEWAMRFHDWTATKLPQEQ